MVREIRDRLVLKEIELLERARGAARRLAARVGRVRGDEAGQTPTEYLMIVGLMAAVIVLVFVTFYWANVKTAAQSWVDKVKEAVLGTNITP